MVVREDTDVLFRLGRHLCKAVALFIYLNLKESRKERKLVK